MRELPQPSSLGGADALLDLSNFSGWARLLRNGVPTSPIHLALHDAPLPRRPDVHRLIETSHGRFGRERSDVEQRIRRFLGIQA